MTSSKLEHSQRTRVLYISILGMSEPLGQSQVLEYLKSLASDYAISLHSFEKDLSSETLAELQAIMQQHHIHWSYQSYSNRFGVLSTLLQIISSTMTLIRKVRRENIVHLRATQ